MMKLISKRLLILARQNIVKVETKKKWLVLFECAMIIYILCGGVSETIKEVRNEWKNKNLY